MSKVSKESAPEVVDYGPAEDRTDHFHGYTVEFYVDPRGLGPRSHAQGVAG